MQGLLKINDTSELLIRYPSLTPKQEKEYLAGEGDIKCTPESFYVDFKRGWKSFALNKLARHVIIKTFQRKAESNTFISNPPPPEFLTEEALAPFVDAYMKTMRQAYSKQVNPPTKEKQEEMKRRAAQTSRTNTVSLYTASYYHHSS